MALLIKVQPQKAFSKPNGSLWLFEFGYLAWNHLILHILQPNLRQTCPWNIQMIFHVWLNHQHQIFSIICQQNFYQK